MYKNVNIIAPYGGDGDATTSIIILLLVSLELSRIKSIHGQARWMFSRMNKKSSFENSDRSEE
jgi:hypothetical protein